MIEDLQEEENSAGLQSTVVELVEDELLEPAVPTREGFVRRELQALRSVLGAEVLRLIAESGPDVAPMLHTVFGPPPAAPTALSFFLTEVLHIPPRLRRRCLRIRSTVRRLRLLYGWLLAQNRRLEGREEGEEALWDMKRAEREPLNPDKVAPLPHLRPERVLWVVVERATQRRGVGGIFTPGGRLAEWTDRMQDSSALGSLLLLVALFVALWAFAEYRPRH